MRGAHAIAAGAAVLLMQSAFAEEADVPLQRNPFVAPKASEQPLAAFAAPRAPAASEPEPEPEFELRAVLSAGGSSLANIDGDIVGVGQKIDGYRLVAISEHRVVLQGRGRRIVLDVFEDEESERR